MSSATSVWISRARRHRSCALLIRRINEPRWATRHSTSMESRIDSVLINANLMYSRQISASLIEWAQSAATSRERAIPRDDGMVTWRDRCAETGDGLDKWTVCLSTIWDDLTETNTCRIDWSFAVLLGICCPDCCDTSDLVIVVFTKYTDINLTSCFCGNLRNKIHLNKL